MTLCELIGLFVLYNFLGGFTLIMIMIMISNPYSWFCKIDSWAFVNPFIVYRYNTSVNWFGAFVIAFLLSLTCPVGAVLYWIYKLGWLFCKLCTVGRK